KQSFCRLQLIWADGGYAGKLVNWAKEACQWILEIVKRNDEVKGFHVLPRLGLLSEHWPGSDAIADSVKIMKV
ncbi:unnamed protein product, partial [marine sediment metagenome]